MPVDDKLLEILCCPVTKVAVKRLPEEQRKKLNDLIKKGTVHYQEGGKVENAVEEALITEDGKTIYTVNGGIPVMLADKRIPASQLDT